jgi:hypothetical protein
MRARADGTLRLFLSLGGLSPLLLSAASCSKAASDPPPAHSGVAASPDLKAQAREPIVELSPTQLSSITIEPVGT